jgi:hypothetical protein
MPSITIDIFIVALPGGGASVDSVTVDNQNMPTGYKWQPVTDLPTNPKTLTDVELKSLRGVFIGGTRQLSTGYIGNCMPHRYGIKTCTRLLTNWAEHLRSSWKKGNTNSAP